ncbi:MAG TPA: hypothetical protein VM308_09155 [Sphingomicrobium sp.]|nr:hypothetical protein [Sphingomicrobium sp.]
MTSERLRDLFRPWSALALGTLGFFLAHQLGSSATFQDCRVGSPWLVIVGTIAGLALVGAGAIGSWRIFAREGETQARKLIAAIGLLTAIMFAMGILLPLIAALVIPACWA